MKRIVFILVFLLASNVSHAGLMGSGVLAHYHAFYYGNIDHTEYTTVTEGHEWGSGDWLFATWGSHIDVDIGDDYMFFEYQIIGEDCIWRRCYWVDADYIGFEFIFDSGTLADLVAASFRPNSDGYVDSMLSFSGDTFYLNWSGGNITGASAIWIDLTFSSVSEPSSIAIFLLGFAGLALSRARRHM